MKKFLLLVLLGSSFALSFAQTIHIDLIDSTFAPETVLIRPDFFFPFTEKAVFELEGHRKKSYFGIDQYIFGKIIK